MMTTVEELISALAKYPKNMKVYSNLITQNLKGELVMEHQRTPEEEKKHQKEMEDFDKRYKEEMDRSGEIKMFLTGGNLYYWQHRIVVQYIGIREEGEYMFKTTNGGMICLKQDEVQSQISEDNKSRNYK